MLMSPKETAMSGARSDSSEVASAFTETLDRESFEEEAHEADTLEGGEISLGLENADMDNMESRDHDGESVAGEYE